MSIDKDLLDRLMEGRSPGDLFGKDGILSELTKALAERALGAEMDVHIDEERAEEACGGRNQAPNRRNGSNAAPSESSAQLPVAPPASIDVSTQRTLLWMAPALQDIF